MTISLGDDANAIIDAAVASGQFASPEAVVDAGLRLLAERERKLDWLRKKIRKSIDSIEQNGGLTDEEVGNSLDQLLEEAERKQAAK